MVALSERLPLAYDLLPPAGQLALHERRAPVAAGAVADRHAARADHRAGPQLPGLVDWHADRQRLAELHTDQRRVGAVVERRVAVGLRAWASIHDPAADHQPPTTRLSDRRTNHAAGWRGPRSGLTER